MYLDNMMNKKTQKIFYGVFIVMSILLIVAGGLFWHTDILSQSDQWPNLLRGNWYSEVGIVAKIIIFSASLSLIASIYSLVVVSTNILALKRNANFFQVIAISFMVIAVGAAIFDAIDRFHRRHTLYELWGPTKSHFEMIIKAQQPPVPIKGNLDGGMVFYQQMLDNGWNALSFRMSATWIEIAASALGLVPLFLYFGKSGHYLS